MSKLTDAYWKRVQRQASQYTPRVRSSIIRAVDSLKSRLTDGTVQRMMASGDLNILTLKVFDAASMDASFATVDAAVQSVVKNGLETTVRTSIPKGGKINGVPAVHFNILNDNVVAAIKTLDMRVMSPLKAGISEAARKEFARGVKEGLGPRAIARNMRDLIGVSPNQADAIANFRGLLETGDRAALSRSLRDRRFDSTLAKLFDQGASPSESQIDTMVSAYARRMVAFNAETNARTMTLDALKSGQRLAWESAVDQGIVDGDRLMKTWVGVKDDRERDEHLAMEGETVPFDEPYSNGEMEPGESTYNCRCVSYVFEARASSEKDTGDAIKSALGIDEEDSGGASVLDVAQAALSELTADDGGLEAQFTALGEGGSRVFDELTDAELSAMDDAGLNVSSVSPDKMGSKYGRYQTNDSTISIRSSLNDDQVFGTLSHEVGHFYDNYFQLPNTDEPWWSLGTDATGTNVVRDAFADDLASLTDADALDYVNLINAIYKTEELDDTWLKEVTADMFSAERFGAPIRRQFQAEDILRAFPSVRKLVQEQLANIAPLDTVTVKPLRHAAEVLADKAVPPEWAKLSQAQRALLESHGVTIEHAPLPFGTHGEFDRFTKVISVSTKLATDQLAELIAHETGHAIDSALGGGNFWSTIRPEIPDSVRLGWSPAQLALREDVTALSSRALDYKMTIEQVYGPFTSDAVLHEVVADMIAAVQFGVHVRDIFTASQFEAMFPKVANVVRAALQGIK